MAFFPREPDGATAALYFLLTLICILFLGHITLSY